jgi:hypothetical protein
MGVKPQGSDHGAVWVEFILRYPLSETGITSDPTKRNASTFERYQKGKNFEITQLWIN